MWPTLFSLRLALSQLAPRKARRRSPTFRRPALEALEDRTVPSGASLAGYGQLPLSFEVNRGQTAPQVNYLARGSGYTLFLSATQATLGLTHATGTPSQAPTEDVLRLGLVGANSAAPAVGLDRLPGVSNYFIGSDPSKWLTNVPNYGEVEYPNVYPGVNLVYYGNQGQLEYDFVLAPGANAGAIRLSVQGAQSVRLDAQGDLVLHTAGGDVVQHAPVVYQNIGGQRQSVAGRFVLEGNGQVGFRVGAYDHRAPLVIDPVLVYSTYLAGSNGESRGQAIAVDSAGDAYLTGWTNSTNFPRTAGALQTTPGGGFVSKLNASGTALVYSTYLGGSGYGIAVDSSGDAYVTGNAGSNLATTPDAFQPSSSVGGAFVTKLNAAGSGLVYSTYVHGSGGEQGLSIALDSSGDAYITGWTLSQDFPTTANAFQKFNPNSNPGDSTPFVTELNTSGSGLVYSTYLDGGSWGNYDEGNGIAVDAAGEAYVTGMTSATNFPTTAGAFQTSVSSPPYLGVPFVTKLNATGSGLVYSTYLSSGPAGFAIALDAGGNAYVTGGNGITKLSPSGSALVYSTSLPASLNAIAVDASGDAFAAGSAGSNLPLVQPLQGFSGGTNDEACVLELSPGGSALLFSTYLGGSGGDVANGIALDGSGSIYVTGQTNSTNFPTTPGALQPTYAGAQDAFVAKISLTPLPPSPSFAVAGFPSSTTAGVAHTFTVTALNADGSVNTGYTGTVHFSSSDPKAVPPADYTFTAADQGVHTFTVTLKTAGSQSITATDTVTGSIAGSESGIMVQPAAAAKFVLSAPASVTHGAAFSVTLTVYDAYGNVATGYTGTVHFKSSDSTATLPANYTFTAADAGVRTFVNLVLRKRGTQTITVTDTQNSALTATDNFSVL